VKAAIISDIHGNSPALKSVLDAIQKEKPDAIYVLGDVAHGVDPKGCLQQIHDLANCRCIKGNFEHYMSVHDYGGWNRLKDGNFRFRVEWRERVLSVAGRDLFDFMCSWPDYLREDDAYFMHLAPWDHRLAQEEGSDLPPELREFAYHGRGVLPGMDESDTREINDFIATIEVSVLFCGHTHLPFIRKLESGLLVNCGSVGQPFGRDPRAAWIAWEDDDSCSIRRTPYDIDRTVALQAGSAERIRIFRLCLEVGEHSNEIMREEDRTPNT
jgi:predicted phosphodiesterase